jgi:hypothetical protein
MKKFNNQVVKTGCCCIYMRTDLSENRVSLNFLDNMIGSHQPKKIYILENQ